MMIIPGELNQLIAVTKPVSAQNASGRIVESTETLFSAYARVRGVRSQTKDQQGASQFDETLEFVTWYRDGVTSACRIRWRGTEYQVERCSPVPESSLYMVIYAHSLRRLGA